MSLEDKVTINDWQKAIHLWAELKGWNQDLNERSFGDWMALMHTEISEAYEDYRKHYDIAEVYYEKDGKEYTKMIGDPIAMAGAKPCGIPIEMADLAIRLLHFCEYFGIDLNRMIALKMQYNETRSHRHGGKKV